MDFKLTAAPIDPAALSALMEDARAGAVVAFEGRVRIENEGREVRELEYEAYGELAVAEGLRVVREARERFPAVRVSCVHRTGRLGLGEVAVWVGVAAPHRAAAFEACRYVIDEVKARVPIWKKEHYRDGSSGWINCATRGPGADAPAG